jgi:hypothetical protein
MLIGINDLERALSFRLTSYGTQATAAIRLPGRNVAEFTIDAQRLLVLDRLSEHCRHESGPDRDLRSKESEITAVIQMSVCEQDRIHPTQSPVKWLVLVRFPEIWVMRGEIFPVEPLDRWQ